MFSHHFDTCISLYNSGHSADQGTACHIVHLSNLENRYIHQRQGRTLHRCSRDICSNKMGPTDQLDRLRRRRILNKLK